MITQILACCKYCDAQSMWYDVVNRIPCLVILLILCVCAVISLGIFLKHKSHCLKEYKLAEEEKLKVLNRACTIGEDIKKQLSDFANKENQLREENQVLKKKLTMMEELWRGYKEQLEKLYKSQFTKSEEDMVGENTDDQGTK